MSVDPAKIPAEWLGNHTLTSTTYGTTVSITATTPTIAFKPGVSLDKTYDGKPVADPGSGDLSLSGVDYKDVTFTWYGSADKRLDAAPTNAGIYTVKAEAKTSGNSESAEAVLKVVISKATISPSVERSYTRTAPAKDNIDLGKLLPADAGSPVKFGNDGNASAAAKVFSDMTLTTDGHLNITTLRADEDRNATLTFPSDSPNYTGSIKLTVKLVAASPVTLDIKDIAKTYDGKPGTITGTAKADGKSLDGQWAFAQGEDVTNVPGGERIPRR